MPEGRLENEKRINKTIDKILEKSPQYIREWNNYLYANGKTASSRKDFINKIIRFLSSIDKDIMQVAPQDITSDSINEYMINIRTKKTPDGKIVETSGSYRQTIYCALNNFLKFMKRKGYIKENYIDDIDYPKSNDLERINEKRVLLTEEEFGHILDEAKKESNDFLRYRDICILSLFMTTGIRETALMSINREDINFLEGKLIVIDKGDKSVDCPLSEYMINTLNNWLDIRGNEDGALFISRLGSRMTPLAISNVVKKYTQKALGKELSAHKLRAGFASITYKNNPDILFVQRAMGHANSSTTQRYIVTENKEREIASGYIADFLNRR